MDPIQARLPQSEVNYSEIILYSNPAQSTHLAEYPRMSRPPEGAARSFRPQRRTGQR